MLVACNWWKLYNQIIFTQFENIHNFTGGFLKVVLIEVVLQLFCVGIYLIWLASTKWLMNLWQNIVYFYSVYWFY